MLCNQHHATCRQMLKIFQQARGFKFIAYLFTLTSSKAVWAASFSEKWRSQNRQCDKNERRGRHLFLKKKERKWNEMRLKPKYISCPVECASQISSIYQGDKTDIAIYSNNIRKLLRDKIPQAVVYKRKSR